MNDIVSAKTHFFLSGLFIVRRTISSRTTHNGGQALRGKFENLVIFVGLKPFHRACVDAEQSRARQKISKCDVSLARRPFVRFRRASARYEIVSNRVTKLLQSLDSSTTQFRRSCNMTIDVFARYLRFRREDHKNASNPKSGVGSRSKEKVFRAFFDQ